MPANATANGSLKSHVLLYLNDNPGKLVPAGEIAARFGVTETQAGNALSAVMREANSRTPDQVERPLRGVYRWNPEVAVDEDELLLFTVIRELRPGKVLVADDNGDLFTVTKMEV